MIICLSLMSYQYTEKTRTYEFLVKFKVEVENSGDSSSIISASGAPSN